ncbi:fibronectin type III domain-containing protein [Aeromicrobium sp.]|uniref:fibronectin type III domain-containing protein n=1 Tax=Aeromicrobium sp. TaxID=1871063 RepID=UPI00199E248D|nr:fibronectin type III domain-containing protein [Aeromicrobium sp.]MBC7631445.1 fibronectin type III domain-containing protein [Aeromicrobium sp.]
MLVTLLSALAAMLTCAVAPATPAQASGGVAPQLLSFSSTPTEVTVGGRVTVAVTSDTPLSYVKFTFSGSNGGGRTPQWGPGGATSSNFSNIVIADFEAGVQYTLQSILLQATDGTQATYLRNDTVTKNPSTAPGPSEHALDFAAADFHVAPTEPAAPGAVTVSPGDGRAYISWTAPADHGGPISSYTITPSPSGAVGRVDGSATSAVVEGLENGTGYTFGVIATNSLGDSPTAYSGQVTPGPGLGRPAQPQSVSARAGVNMAKVYWQPPIFDGGSSITAYTAAASPGGQSCTVSGSARSCYVPGLTNGVTYTFTLTAKNNSGTSDSSEPSNPVTPTQDTQPAAVVSSTVTPHRVSSLGGTVTVELRITDDVSGSVSSNYVLFRNAAGKMFGFGAANRISGDEYDGVYRRVVTVPTGTAIGLYQLSVYPTHDAAGNDGTFLTRPGLTVGTPAPPTNVSASADGARQVTVTWDAPTDDGGNVITGYQVTTSPGGQTYTTTGTSLTASFASWPEATSVLFTVRATNAAGTSDSSEPSPPLTVPAVAPSAPIITGVTVGNQSVTTTWSPPSADGGSPVSGYTATAHPGGASCTTSTQSCAISDLNNGSNYTITVTATNSGGTSPDSTPSNSVSPIGPVLAFRTDQANVTVAESSGTQSLVVVRSGNTNVPATVDYARSGGTATPGEDFILNSGTLNFAEGQTTKTIPVIILGDGVRDPGETIEISLTGPSVGATVSSPQTATVTIADDDTAVVAFAQSTRTLTETAGTVQLTVTRTGNTTIPATVGYARTGGNATPGADFTLTAGTLNFAAGETTKSIEVSIVNDVGREAAESLVISLDPGDGDTSLGARATTTVTIAPSDQLPDGGISSSASSGYVGNNVYNTTAFGQTKTASAKRTATRTFYARLYNDGNVTNNFIVRGSAALAGSTVRYYSGTTNITTAMRSTAGWIVTLRPGAYKLIKVRVTVLRTARTGSLKPATVSTRWLGDASRTDVVKGVVKVTT